MSGRALQAAGKAPEQARRIYSAAVRHSRFVSFLKLAIPLGSITAIGTIAFIGIFDPFKRLEGLQLGPVSLSDGGITMEAPTLTGHDRNSRPYVVKADKAVQDPKKPTVIKLEIVKGKFLLDGASRGVMEALTGLLDTQTEKLELKRDIQITTDNGYIVKLSSANMDLKAKRMVSRDPVEVTLPNGRVDADTLEITDNGKVAAFIGNVRTFMESNELSAKGAPKLKDGDGAKRSPLNSLSGNGKDPIRITSERLDIADKDKKAVFSGKVVTVQGETTMRCVKMIIHYEQAAKTPGAKGSGPAAMTDGSSNITKMDCVGPVEVLAKDQKATGDNATYDKVADKVYLIGNARVSQGDNFTSGERLTYDLGASHAIVEGQRVKAQFVQKDKDGDKSKAAKEAKPEPGKAKGKDGKAPAFAIASPSSGEPMKIDSGRLELFDKERKAVFSGDVVAVQGETTMQCSTLVVFYEQGADKEPGAKKGEKGTDKNTGAENGVRKLDCSGPVTVISKDQVGTGDRATYDKAANRIYLTGNTKLSQGENVTIGKRVIYDLTTSQAMVETTPGERVKALITPKSMDGKGDAKGTDAKGAETKTTDPAANGKDAAGRNAAAEPAGAKAKKATTSALN